MGYCGADDLLSVAMSILLLLLMSTITTPAENNGHDDVTELPVTLQRFGMLLHHKYAQIWCDDTKII